MAQIKVCVHTTDKCKEHIKNSQYTNLDLYKSDGINKI